MDIPLAERVLYADPRCLVINKIPGEAVEGAGPGMADLSALAGALLPAGPGGIPPAPVHRLDAPASGCVLFARRKGALVFLNRALAAGGIEKRYWAVLEESASLDEAGELVHWMGGGHGGYNKVTAFAQPAPGRKRAALRYRVIGRGERYVFAEITLLTGRHHQIRAQLAAAGLHIKGDLKYGARRSDPNGGIRLHARLLSFPDPRASEAGRMLQVCAPPPFRDRLWAAFEASGGSGGPGPPGGGYGGSAPLSNPLKQDGVIE